MSHKKGLTILTAILAIFTVLMIIDIQPVKHAADSSVQAKSLVSDDVWALTFTDLDNEIVPLTNFFGVPVVIQSWSTSCLFCTQEMANLVRFHAEYGNRVQFVTINRGETLDDVLPFITAQDTNHQLHHLIDDGDLFYTVVNGKFEPETVFISPEGELVLQAQGPISEQEMRTLLDKMLP